MPEKKKKALGVWFSVTGDFCPLLGICMTVSGFGDRAGRMALLAGAILLAGWAAGALHYMLGPEDRLEYLAGRLGRPFAALAYWAGYLACLLGAAVFLRLGAEVWRTAFWPAVPAALLLVPLLAASFAAGRFGSGVRAALGAAAGAAGMLPLSLRLPWAGAVWAALLFVSLLLSASSLLWYMDRALGRLLKEAGPWRRIPEGCWLPGAVGPAPVPSAPAGGQRDARFRAGNPTESQPSAAEGSLESGRAWERIAPVFSVALVYFAAAGFLDGEAALDYWCALHFALFLPLLLLLLLLLRRENRVRSGSGMKEA